MRWVTYRSGEHGNEHVGLVHGGQVHGLRGDAHLIDLIAGGRAALESAAASVQADPLEVVPESAVVLRAPIPVPPSIRDFMSFEEHVVASMKAMGRELSPGWYELPTFYFTNPAAVRGAYDAVEIAPGSLAFDYELEVAVVIGKPGSNISVTDAANHIAGYTILGDWSARDLQEHEMLQGLGPAKGKDTATSIGPYLVTPDELEDRRTEKGYRLEMTASVNGKSYSKGNFAQLYWSFEQMISYASRGTRLVPGDVLGSGTVGTGCILELSRVHGGDAFPWLVPGDDVRLAVERLGFIQATIRPGVPVLPLSSTARD